MSEDNSATDDSASRHLTRDGLRRIVLALLVAALLAALIVCGWLLSNRMWLVPTAAGEVEERHDARQEIMARAEEFMLRVGTFGPELLNDQNKMPAYREQVLEVITDDLASSFKKKASIAERLVARFGLSRDAKVFGTGVASLEVDEGSATALVARSFSDTYEINGKRVTQPPVPFRMEVELVRVDGEWLVTSFGAIEETPAPFGSGAPSPSGPSGSGAPSPSGPSGSGAPSPSGPSGSGAPSPSGPSGSGEERQ